MIPLNLILTVSAIMFGLGLFALLTRRNAVAVFMGIELMLNSANLNLVAFSQKLSPEIHIDGQVAAIFVMMLAAAEFAVALALILSLFQNFRSIHVDEAKEMKG